MGCPKPPRTCLLSALLLLALAPAATGAQPAGTVDPLAAETALFYSEGPALLVTCEAWSLFAPLVDKASTPRRNGTFISGGEIFTFRAPRIAKLPDLKSNRWVQLHNLKLQKVAPSLNGPVPSNADLATAVTLNFKIPKGAANDWSGKRQAVLSGALPYALRFGSATASMAASSGIKLQTSAKLKSKNKAVKLVLPETYAFHLVTQGSVAVVCADGYGGTLKSGTASGSGCSICAVGQFGANLSLGSPCLKCSDAGVTAFSDKPGAATCSACTNALAANAAGTGCGHAVQTYTTLFLNEPACTDKIISDTHDAYVAFLKTQPGIVPDSVVVTITCTDLSRRRSLLQDKGIALDVTSSFQGTDGAAQQTVDTAVQCCPVKEGCPANTPCGSDGLKGTATGASGAQGANDPCEPNPCNVNGAACAGQKGDVPWACVCKTGYAGTTCSECVTGYLVTSGSQGAKDVTCTSVCQEANPCNPQGTLACAPGAPAQCTCKDHYTGATCSECQDGYFAVVAGNTTTCEKCDDQCATCKTSANNCLACRYEHFTEASGCVQCADGFFNDTALTHCNQCDGTCTTCTGDASSCTSCANSSYEVTSKCLCLPGTYLDISSGQCKSCAENCAHCTGPANADCSECAGKFDRMAPTDACGTVEIATPEDVEYVGITSCPGLPPYNANSGCTGNTFTKNFFVNGPNVKDPTETSSSLLWQCASKPGYGVSYAWNNDSSYPHPEGVLARWKGSLDLTVHSDCGGGLGISAARTSALKGVRLSQVQRLGYRVRRNLPSSAEAAAQPINFHLGLQFDFDNDTTACAGTGCDGVYQGRMIHFYNNSHDSWVLVNAIDGGAPDSAAVWSRTSDNIKGSVAKNKCWIGGGNPYVCGPTSLWTGAAPYYPMGGFQSLGGYGPGIWLKWGTNSGASLPDTWQWSIDSIFVEWVDNSGVAQKKTWAFKMYNKP